MSEETSHLLRAHLVYTEKESMIPLYPSPSFNLGFPLSWFAFAAFGVIFISAVAAAASWLWAARKSCRINGRRKSFRVMLLLSFKDGKKRGAREGRRQLAEPAVSFTERGLWTPCLAEMTVHRRLFQRLIG